MNVPIGLHSQIQNLRWAKEENFLILPHSSIFFPHFVPIFFLNLVLQVGGSSTRKSTRYASAHIQTFTSPRTHNLLHVLYALTTLIQTPLQPTLISPSASPTLIGLRLIKLTIPLSQPNTPPHLHRHMHS